MKIRQKNRGAIEIEHKPPSLPTSSTVDFAVSRRPSRSSDQGREQVICALAFCLCPLRAELCLCFLDFFDGAISLVCDRLDWLRPEAPSEDCRFLIEPRAQKLGWQRVLVHPRSTLVRRRGFAVLPRCPSTATAGSTLEARCGARDGSKKQNSVRPERRRFNGTLCHAIPLCWHPSRLCDDITFLQSSAFSRQERAPGPGFNP